MTDTAVPTAGSVGRTCWSTLEAIHILGYFAPETRDAYKALGISGTAGYFASRSAPMGPVPAEVTVATFYVFAPSLVSHFIPAAWEVASPAQVLEARHRGMTEVLHRVFGDGPADLDEALALTKTATEGLAPQGRPLYAGHASLPWPEEPLLALWHGASLIREHRGDGHIAALLTHGLDPVEAMVTYGQTSGMTDFLKLTRAWTEDEWAAGVERCRARGLVDGEGLITEAGRGLRTQVESMTDRLSTAGWEHLGLEGAQRLAEILVPMRRSLADSGVFPFGLAGIG